MKPIRAPVAALAIAMATPAAAQDATIESAIEALRRMAIQYGVLITRFFVDVTYDAIAVEPGTGDVVVSGLRFYPELEWDAQGGCVVEVRRLSVADANGPDALGSSIGIDGLAIPPACLEPAFAETLASFGYQGMALESAAVDVDYHIPSSSAEIVVGMSLADAADIGLSASFDYVWLRLPMTDGTDPEATAVEAEPIVWLGSAEMVVENRGLWQAFEPMLSEQLGGDLSAIPDVVRLTLGEMLSEGGARALSPAESALVNNVASQVARFIEHRDRIVVTAAPEDGSVRLTKELMSSPRELVEALDPVVSATPAAYRRMIAPAELAAALAGGEGLDRETRLRVGEALVTGIGAPRSVQAGRALLAPLADAWDPDAALLSARAARGSGDLPLAYAMALRAMAGGETDAILLADEIEAEMPLPSVLSAQLESAGAWPGADRAADDALLREGDVAGIRRRAELAASGRNRPRDYAEAYYWASLAAAAGDRGAAALRDRLDARFAGQEDWRDTAAAQAARALETWTGGLAETLAARVE